jgi:hypothetical protein
MGMTMSLRCEQCNDCNTAAAELLQCDRCGDSFCQEAMWNHDETDECPFSDVNLTIELKELLSKLAEGRIAEKAQQTLNNEYRDKILEIIGRPKIETDIGACKVFYRKGRESIDIVALRKYMGKAIERFIHRGNSFWVIGNISKKGIEELDYRAPL